MKDAAPLEKGFHNEVSFMRSFLEEVLSKEMKDNVAQYFTTDGTIHNMMPDTHDGIFAKIFREARGLEEDAERWDELTDNGRTGVTTNIGHFLSGFPKHHHMAFEICRTEPVLGGGMHVILEIAFKGDEGQQLNYNGRMLLTRDERARFGYKTRYASWIQSKQSGLPAATLSSEGIHELRTFGEM
eukprot:GHVS01065717.1.p1 GENE.GHVS01065717.1~~GHVS01065717.1.p1  ORF type:complete len:185 (-),score=25.27 GHVS01065717.1:301-855(-)